MPERPNAPNARAEAPTQQREGAPKADRRNPVVSKPVPQLGLTRKRPTAKANSSAKGDLVTQPKATGGFRARRVHRVVLRVDPWSVLKLSLVFLFCFWLMMVIASILMWGAAVSSGTVTNLEDFIATLLSFEEFKLNGSQILRFFAMLGLIMVFVGTALSAIVAVLFNLVTSVIGGVRFTVIEEESMRRIIRE